jgi:hypothetical protein
MIGTLIQSVAAREVTNIDAGKEMVGAIDSWNKIFGQRGIAVTEYGAGASIYHHVEEPGHPYSNGMWHQGDNEVQVQGGAGKNQYTDRAVFRVNQE